MKWINGKAKSWKQGAVRAVFDRANSMTGVTGADAGEPGMTTPARTSRFCDGPRHA